MYLGLLLSTFWIPRFVLNMGREIRDVWKREAETAFIKHLFICQTIMGGREDMSQVEKAVWMEMGQFYSDTNFYNVI